MTPRIETYENHDNWRATAIVGSGPKRIFVMQGAPPLEGSFYLYQEDWNSVLDAQLVLKPYSSGQIAALFESGSLTLVKGSIPS